MFRDGEGRWPSKVKRGFFRRITSEKPLLLGFVAGSDVVRAGRIPDAGADGGLTSDRCGAFSNRNALGNRGLGRAFNDPFAPDLQVVRVP